MTENMRSAETSATNLEEAEQSSEPASATEDQPELQTPSIRSAFPRGTPTPNTNPKLTVRS